jgi:hypothetical protein
VLFLVVHGEANDATVSWRDHRGPVWDHRAQCVGPLRCIGGGRPDPRGCQHCGRGAWVTGVQCTAELESVVRFGPLATEHFGGCLGQISYLGVCQESVSRAKCVVIAVSYNAVQCSAAVSLHPTVGCRVCIGSWEAAGGAGGPAGERDSISWLAIKLSKGTHAGTPPLYMYLSILP